MYPELLKLCGFEPEEIEKEMARVGKAFKIVGIEPEDMPQIEKRIAETFDVGLKGMRKILGIWLREFIAAILARDERKKVIHTTILGPPERSMAVTLASKDVYCGEVGWIVTSVLGGIFGRINPVIEAAEQRALTQDGDHCGFDKIRLGMYLLDIVPKPDLFADYSCACDDSPKTGELICELFDMPSCPVNICQDQHPETLPEISLRQFDYLSNSLKRSNERFEQVIGFKITDEMAQEAMEWRRKINIAYSKIIGLMRHDPQPISQADLNLLHMLVMMPVLERERVIEAMEILYGEIEQRTKEGVGVVERGAPRVMIPVYPSNVDPEFTRMIEQAGLAIPVVEMTLPGARRPLTKARDGAELLARRMLVTNLQLVYTQRIETIIEACRTWDLDGVLWANHHSCRIAATDATMIETAVKEQLGLPMIILDFEQFNPRYYSSAQLRTRIEAFAEMLGAAKANKGKSGELWQGYRKRLQ